MSAKRHPGQILALIQAIQDKRRSPESLSSHLRIKIVQYFLTEQSEVTTRQVADITGLSESAVVRARRRLIRDAAWEIKDIDIEALAAGLLIRKRDLQRRALTGFAPDLALVWRIEVEYIEKMQDLGFVYKAPAKILKATAELDIRAMFKEFFNEYGVLPLPDFTARLKELAEGDGHGDTRGIDGTCVKPGAPGGGGRESETEGIED